MAELDFSALNVTKAELPAKKGSTGRAAKYKENPFVGWLGEAYKAEEGRSVTVPNEQATEVEYLIRKAAEELGIGVRVVFSLDKEARKKAAKDKPVQVAFQEQKKRKYNPRAKAGAVTVTTPAADSPAAVATAAVSGDSPAAKPAENAPATPAADKPAPAADKPAPATPAAGKPAQRK